MTIKNLSLKLKDAIERYTGREVTELECVSDPQVPGTWAIRAGVRRYRAKDANKGVKYIEFLVLDVKESTTVEELERSLEECEFTNWPPTPRG